MLEAPASTRAARAGTTCGCRPRRQVCRSGGDECSAVGLAADADRRVGGYSLGMRQRLGSRPPSSATRDWYSTSRPTASIRPAWPGCAAAARPGRAGRTVIVSSHVLSEVAQTVDRVVIVNEGRLRFDGPLGNCDADGTLDRPSSA